MGEWKEVRLGDVLNFRRGYDLPKNLMSDGPIPVAGSNGIIGWHDTPSNISPVITIGRSGSVGKPKIYDKAWAHNTTLYIDDFKGNDPKFLYYLLLSLPLEQAQAGSAVPTLNRNHIHPLHIIFPNNLSEQRKIAEILSVLDAKIETNRRINARLEELAQAIFKSWFIDFEPFGGVMPEEWKILPLGDVCKCVLGGTPNRAKPEYWNGSISWINSGEINKFRIIEPSEYITEVGLDRSATKLLPKGTVVLAITGATLGKVSLLEIDACANQSVVGILESKQMPYTYLYPFVNSSIKELTKLQTGGAQQHINKQNVESLSILIPMREAMEQYDSIVRPIYKKIADLCFESARLAELRDALLPKLMSGELTPE